MVFEEVAATPLPSFYVQIVYHMRSLGHDVAAQ